MWTRLYRFFVRLTDKVVDVNAVAGSAELAQPARSRLKWRPGRIILTSGLLVLFFFVSIYCFNETALSTAKRQLEDARSRNELLRPMREKKTQADAMLAAIDQKQTILRMLTQDRLSYYVVLAEVAVKAPPQLWLTSLEAGRKGSLEISGTAPSPFELALFIERLGQDAILAEPSLVKTGEDTDLTARQFHLTVRIRER